jgi:S-DNA-T family DNA segregation ATPase FtsK/SpoIIIE
VFVLPAALEAQLAPAARRARAAGHGDATTVAPVAPIERVPTNLRAHALPTGARSDDADLLPLGVDAGTGAPAFLEVPDGEHVLVLGAARSGRSTTLTRLVVAWRDAHPDGVVVAVLPRRSALDRHHIDEAVPASDLARLAAVVDPSAAQQRAVLVVVDDAELVDDPETVLARLAASRRPGCTIVAAARPDAIRQVYGHWTGVLRRSRLGIIATGGSDTDGDLLGVLLPRRAPIEPRAGLVWIADRGRCALAQVAIDAPKFVDVLRVAN